jgi:NAD(P)-dependent dehydrogenase (short-subunit alcohol dehydrogenase family)
MSAMAKPSGSIVITGANGTLGSAIVRHIAQSTELSSNLYGIFSVRNPRADSNLKSVLQQTPEELRHDVLSIDLSLFSSVRDAAKDINERVANGALPPIRALIINAAFQEYTTQTFSPEGLDASFQINYISQFLLILLLLQSMDKENGRIIIIGSSAHE